MTTLEKAARAVIAHVGPEADADKADWQEARAIVLAVLEAIRVPDEDMKMAVNGAIFHDRASVFAAFTAMIDTIKEG